jgi:hypothetical protein
VPERGIIFRFLFCQSMASLFDLYFARTWHHYSISVLPEHGKLGTKMNT